MRGAFKTKHSILHHIAVLLKHTDNLVIKFESVKQVVEAVIIGFFELVSDDGYQAAIVLPSP